MRQTGCWRTSRPDCPICEMDPEDVENIAAWPGETPRSLGAGDESRTRVLSLGNRSGALLRPAETENVLVTAVHLVNACPSSTAENGPVVARMWHAANRPLPQIRWLRRGRFVRR